MSTVLLVASLTILAAVLIWLSTKDGVLPPGWSKWVLAAGTALSGIVLAIVAFALSGRSKSDSSEAAPVPPDPAVPAGPTPARVKDLDDRAARVDQEIKDIRAAVPPKEGGHAQGVGSGAGVVVDDDALGDFVRDRESVLHGKP